MNRSVSHKLLGQLFKKSVNYVNHVTVYLETNAKLSAINHKINLFVLL